MKTRVFVINLLKDAARLDGFRKEMHDKWPGIDYEIVQAVYGRELSEVAFSRLVDVARARRVHKRDIGRGEVGVVCSMQVVYKKMVSENIEQALIFEDDALLGSGLARKIPAIEEWLMAQSKPTVLLLSQAMHIRKWKGTRLQETGSKICRPLEIYGAYGYCLNLEAAQTLLHYNTPIFQLADAWASYQRDGVVKVYSVVPHLIGNRDFLRKESNLSSERRALYLKAVDNLPTRTFLERLSGRAVGLLLRMWYWVSGVTTRTERTNDEIEESSCCE